MKPRAIVAALALTLVAVIPATAQEAEKPREDKPRADEKTKAPLLKEEVSTTEHSVTIAGERIDYTATAGYLELPDYEAKPKANIFFIAYVKKGVSDASKRPVTFAFNGGPGSSSVWLHLGALGPRRVVMDPEGMPLPPPYALVENEHSWLDLTDLVFIDPVSTGYSRVVSGESANQFHGVDEDVRSVGEFIRLWTTRNGRWPSPKHLAGESYGTTRCAGLSAYLQDTLGMYLNGIALISPVLDFSTIRFDVGNDTPFWLYLPTYTATAWHHQCLSSDLQADLDATLRQAEAWASTDYLLALSKGDRLSEPERESVIANLMRFTGLSREFIVSTDLRIQIGQFCKQLLRDRDRTVGRLDSRYTGIDRNSAGAGADHDPSLTAITGPYTATLYHYLRHDLGHKNDLVYEILTGRVQPWSYRGSENRYLNVGESLRAAMSKNPALKVFYACGYYDLATPYFAMDYTAAHLGLDPTLRANLTAAYYRSGHMMYVRLDDLAKLRRDAAAALYAP